MTDRRGAALPGEPPLPPGSPPIVIDLDSVNELYCATRSIALPDSMADSDSDSRSKDDSSSADERSSSSGEEEANNVEKAFSWHKAKTRSL